MVITKMSLPRRTFLRGVGAALALPMLDAMVSALPRAAAPKMTRLLRWPVLPNGARSNMTGPYREAARHPQGS